MYGNLASTPIDGVYSIEEPPAGMLTPINKRIQLFSDADKKVTLAEWEGIFVLACLHELVEGIKAPVACKVALSLGYAEATNLRSVFCKLTDDQFKEVVAEFIFSIDKTTLEQWFSLVDDSQYISKKKQDDEKKD